MLLAKDEANYELFRKTFSLETKFLIEAMVERNVSIFSLDHDFSNKDIIDYFEVIIDKDNRLLFELFHEGIIAKLSKEKVDTLLFRYCSINILKYLCEQGEYQTVAVEGFTKALSARTGQEFEQLLHWICSRFDCQSLLQEGFKDFGCWSKKRWDLLFSLGMQPTQEQRAGLKEINPAFYKAIFTDDV